MKPRFTAAAVSVIGLTSACQGPRAGDNGAQPSDSVYTYAVPAADADGWAVGSIHDVGLRLGPLIDLVGEIRAQRLANLHSVLIVKDDKLVFEEYFEGPDERRGQPLPAVRFDRHTLHDLRSVTKSVTSTLVGIAIGQGKLSITQPVLSVLSGHADLAQGPKTAIAIRDLLTMTSGLEWDEESHPYTDPRNSETAMDLSNSSVRYVLTRDLAQPPGTRFEYCGGCTMLLAAVIQEVTGQPLDRFAAEFLFRPLGIQEFEWLAHRDGLPIAASGLRLRPRDMAKIGYLYVNEGRWSGQQIVPASWIVESTRTHVPLDSISGYGYQWWIDVEPLNGRPTPLPIARGNGGQRIYVVPELRLVAVITAGNYNSPAGRHSEQAFWRYILPSAVPVRSDP